LPGVNLPEREGDPSRSSEWVELYLCCWGVAFTTHTPPTQRRGGYG
jgi:hypothetical protein